jgi:hypothetical protein
MYDTRGKALAKMQELGFPPVFEHIWAGDGPPGFEREAPRFFFEIKPALVQLCPRLTWLVPLLEVNAERILGLDEESGEFLDYSYYDLDAKPIGATYQQFISAVFADLGFAGLADYVRASAKDFEYKYLDVFLAWMDEDNDELSPADAKRLLIRRVAALEAASPPDKRLQAPSAIRAKWNQ